MRPAPRMSRLALAAVLALAAPAFADEDPNAAPFDEFQSKPRLLNVRIDPVAPILDVNAFMQRWGASIDVSVGQAFTIGPSLRAGPSYKIGNSYSFARLLGVTGAWYLNGNSLTTGWVIWPSWFFSSIGSTREEAPQVVTGELDLHEVSALAGFQWFFDQHLNLNVGVGLKYRYGTRNVTIRSAQGIDFTSDLRNNVTIASELMIGWTF
jgi:hypothetical protein